MRKRGPVKSPVWSSARLVSFLLSGNAILHFVSKKKKRGPRGSRRFGAWFGGAGVGWGSQRKSEATPARGGYHVMRVELRDPAQCAPPSPTLRFGHHPACCARSRSCQLVCSPSFACCLADLLCPSFHVCPALACVPIYPPTQRLEPGA